MEAACIVLTALAEAERREVSGRVNVDGAVATMVVSGAENEGVTGESALSGSEGSAVDTLGAGGTLVSERLSTNPLSAVNSGGGMDAEKRTTDPKMRIATQ